MRSCSVSMLLLSFSAYASPLKTVILKDTPFVQQKPDFCGEADVEMALRRIGRTVTQDQVFGLAGVDPLRGRGAHTDELAHALRELGFDPGQVWTKFAAKVEAKKLDEQLHSIVDDLAVGRPSIVCMHYDDTPQTTEHFRLITGYDAETDEIVYQEPAEATGANRRMTRAAFQKLQLFKPRANSRSLIRFRFTPTVQPPPLPIEVCPTRADLAQHVMELKKTLPSGMSLVWEKPFLVIGNEGAAKVKERAVSQVKWTRDLMLADFFAQAPQHIEELWVLKDVSSYRRISKDVFDYTPETPLGYYLSSRNALIMNIKPGYGTLVHEMVHPFMHQNWHDAPAWLNEGLASLFEFPFEEHGHMKGRVNWRLRGLKIGFSRKVVPSFSVLTHLSTNAFYDDPHGVHYAQARYICYWLQQKGLLVTYVKRAQEMKATDATGWTALEEVLEADPDTQFLEWERFVTALNQHS
jgi:hypothetical protein